MLRPGAVIFELLVNQRLSKMDIRAREVLSEPFCHLGAFKYIEKCYKIPHVRVKGFGYLYRLDHCIEFVKVPQV